MSTNQFPQGHGGNGWDGAGVPVPPPGSQWQQPHVGQSPQHGTSGQQWHQPQVPQNWQQPQQGYHDPYLSQYQQPQQSPYTTQTPQHVYSLGYGQYGEPQQTPGQRKLSGCANVFAGIALVFGVLTILLYLFL